MGIRILLIDPNEKVIPRINTCGESSNPKKTRKRFTDQERLERKRELRRLVHETRCTGGGARGGSLLARRMERAAAR